jgi:hypothetical protein
VSEQDVSFCAHGEKLIGERFVKLVGSRFPKVWSRGLLKWEAEMIMVAYCSLRVFTYFHTVSCMAYMVQAHRHALNSIY